MLTEGLATINREGLKGLEKILFGRISFSFRICLFQTKKI